LRAPSSCYRQTRYLTGKATRFVLLIEAVDAALATHHPGWRLSRLQKAWLSFCLMAVLLTNRWCWAQFERVSLGRYRGAAQSWMFHHAKILWERLLPMSVCALLRTCGIREGLLVVDDSNQRRAKKRRVFLGL